MKKKVKLEELLNFTDRQKECWQAIADGFRYILYGGARGGGKDVDLYEIIPTPDGWKTMADIQPGDKVFGSDGRPCNVLAISEIMYNPDYKLSFSDGSEIICGEGHQWITETKSDRISSLRRTEEFRERRRENRPSRGTGKRPDLALRNSTQGYDYKTPAEPVVKTTQEIVDTLRVQDGREVNHAVLVCKPLQLPEKELLIPPYVLGCWLGDGASKGGDIAGIDEEIFTEIEKHGYKVTRRSNLGLRGIKGLLTKIKTLNLYGNKHIPQTYLRASFEQRLELLQGLMDTDGYCNTCGYCEFTNTNKVLIDGVFELISSLGIKAAITEGRAKLYGKDCGPVWDIKFITELPAFRLTRKLNRQKRSEFRGTHERRYIIKAEKVETIPTKCIEVDSPDHTYLIGKSMIPTHNSRFLRWAAVAWLFSVYKAFGIRNVRVGLFCETYNDLRDRQITKMRLEFPAWMGEIKESKEDGFCFFLCDEMGGGIIALRNLDVPEKYQSAEFAAIFVDEITKIPFSTFNILRSSMRWPGIKNTLFLSATNPGGIGHAWVKQLWIDRDFPPEMKAIKHRFKFIQSLPKDNPYLDETYWEELNSLPEDLRRAWVEGDWNIFAGQSFPSWRPNKHIVKPFEIPSHWVRWRSLDWGFSEPFCCLWWAREPVFGHLFVYKEAYFREKTDVQQAQIINAMTLPSEPIVYTLADPALWARKNMQGRVSTTADEYAKNGIPLSRADNNRLSGKRKFDRLLADLPNGYPGIMFFENCANCIRTIPTLARSDKNPEDVNTRGEDHAYDAVRYGLTNYVIETIVEQKYNNPWIVKGSAYAR